MAVQQGAEIALKLEKLQRKYLVRLQERLEFFKSYHEKITHNTLNPDDFRHIKSEAHALKGTGATYGFPEVSAAAEHIDEYLIDDPYKAPKLPALLLALIGACETAVGTKGHDGATQATSDSQSVEASGLPFVLIVDDDPDVQDMLSDLLREVGQCIVASRPSEATELLKTKKPALVLLDDRLADDTSGLGLLEVLRADVELSQIPVMMITASRDSSAVMRGLMAGAVDYITKPFDPTLVVSKVRRHVRRQSTSLLLVDDDESVREIVSFKLEVAGYKVLSAANSSVAWSLLENEPISLILLDQMMPGVDGIALLRKIKADERLAQLPVVILSAKQRGPDIVHALEVGAADYITKPFDTDELVSRCIRLLPVGER